MKNKRDEDTYAANMASSVML